MFTFHGTNPILMWLVWLLVLILLFIFNEISRKSKILGFLSFVVLPIILSILWFTVLKGKSYTDWFHLAKVYSATAGCIGFWAIRFVKGKRKDGSTWYLKDYKL